MLQYPIRRFWFLNRQIDRIQAEKDLKQIQLLGSATSQESYSKLLDRLQKTMGEIVVYEPSVTTLDLDDDGLDPEFDRSALASLKARHCGP